ncbi:hypothetical protein ABFS83_09G129600 [Erythranthe nasuta]
MQRGAQGAVRPKSKLLIIITIHVLVLCSSLIRLSGAAQEQQNIDESELLLKFKSSLQSNNGGEVLADWNASIKGSPCSGNNGNWDGVLCFNGYIWGLQLENMSLKGQIDVNSLVPLRFLRTLSFMGNNFQGSMPDWRKLGALKSLFLSNNQFSGDVPQDAFKGMTSLKKVYMSNNQFTGPIPASLESPKLIELRLENNQFIGTIPAISSDNLKLLNVSNNQLEGPIPAPLSKLDPSSFSGNKALCGKPLDVACDDAIPNEDPSNPSQNKSSSSKIGIIIGCVIGGVLLLIIIVALLLMYRKKSRGGTKTNPQLGRTTSARGLPEVGGGGSSPPVTVKKPEKQQQQPGKLSFVREDRDKFDLQDLMRASAEVLGSGNFGASYKAVLVDGEALVVKRFKQMNTIDKEDFHEHMRRLGRLKHPNLLPLVAYLYRKEEKLLVFDYVHNGSLASQLHGKHSPGLSWATRLKIIKGVAKGMVYLRNELPSLTVAHGHLKSSNVLLDKEYNPLLMDYALVPVVNSAQVHQILVAYKSPEYAKNGHTTKKTDVWCLGMLILETLTGKYVAHQGSAAELAAWINGIGEESTASVFDKEMEDYDVMISSMEIKSEMDNLLKIGISCCQEDPDKRWDLDEALQRIEKVQESSFLSSVVSN